MYLFLDYFLSTFHGGMVIFNLTGWIWKKTRKWHLLTTSLAMFSWFGLGMTYGWGYCPSTDWQWEIKRKLGESDLPNSFIKYMVDKISGFTWEQLIVDTTVVVLGISAFILSCWLNYKDYKHQALAK